MKTQVRILTMLLLCCFTTLEGKAQLNINTQRAFDEFIANKYVTVKRSHNMERDFTMPGNPIKAKSETYTFSLPYKKRDLLQAILQAFNEDANNPLCYNMATHTGGRGVPIKLHDLLIGNSEQNFIRLGENELANWTLICMLDPQDTTRTHRYAYALEYDDSRNKNRDITGRLIVTYARIPQHVLDSNQTNDQPVVAPQMDLAILGTISNTYDFLLAFDALKQDYLKGINTTGIAISLYVMCKEAAQSLQLDEADKAIIGSGLKDMITMTTNTTFEGRHNREYLGLALKALK